MSTANQTASPLTLCQGHFWIGPALTLTRASVASEGKRLMKLLIAWRLCVLFKLKRIYRKHASGNGSKCQFISTAFHVEPVVHLQI